MRWIVFLGALTAACAWTGLAAAYQPAPPQIAYYDYQVIPSFRGQAGTMPPTFAPGQICCESACCCCLHVWDDYCQSKCCGHHFACKRTPSACEDGQAVYDGQVIYEGGPRPCTGCAGGR